MVRLATNIKQSQVNRVVIALILGGALVGSALFLEFDAPGAIALDKLGCRVGGALACVGLIWVLRRLQYDVDH
jgi:hypothetical protein